MRNLSELEFYYTETKSSVDNPGMAEVPHSYPLVAN